MGFFDDISKKMNDTKKNIVATTEKIEKESKLKRDTSNNKQLIEKSYNEIGQKVYEAKGNTAEISDFINAKIEYIDSLLKKNEENRIEILKLNNKRICSNCSSEMAADAAFCPACGKEQEKTEKEPEVEVLPAGKVKCSGCNEVIEVTDTFCPLCGAEQKKEETAVEVNEEVKEENTNE
ncbi:MAG: zinc ribbon domain-containing protein [Clostridia bacterium]|nr:zinc ribbon domain-containing protein [Clostridia bacterium]